MCPIVDGMAVDATNTNAQKLDKVSDDSAIGIIEVANTNTASGSTVTNIQREHNSIAWFVGKALNAIKNALPTWTNNQVGTSGDNLFERVDDLTSEFDGGTGHTHDGTDGNGPNILSTNVSAVALKGSFVQATDLTGVTGTSTNVSTELTGATPSGGTTSKGVVVSAPFNNIVLRQATGTNQGDEFVDGSGNVVYGRLTYAASVWTLSYYVLLSGTETAYSFSSSDVRWYYQQLFNPITDAPVYSEIATIPSDNVTADIITATTTKQGKVQLATAAGAAVASSGSAGTANATVANADHAHAGVHSVAKSGSTALLGDVTFTGTGATSLTQVGQNIQISSTAGATSPLTTKGDLWGYDSADARVPVGSNNLPLIADSAQTLGVKWAALPIAGGGTGATTKAAGFDALSPMTTAGDLIYGGASGTGTRLAVGSNGQVLTLSGGNPVWAPSGATSPIVASYYLGSNTSMTAGSPFNFDTSFYDSDSAVTTGASWKFTAPTGSGTRYYRVSMVLNSVSTALITGNFYKNGSNFRSAIASNSGNSQYNTTAIIIQLTATDYFDYRPAQTVNFTGASATATGCWIDINSL